MRRKNEAFESPRVSAKLQYIKTSSVKVCTPSITVLPRRRAGEGGQAVHDDDDGLVVVMEKPVMRVIPQLYQSGDGILRRP
jgi:hypothetical protein